MFRIGGDYAVVTFTKPFIQNMSRDDVLEKGKDLKVDNLSFHLEN